MNTEYTAKIITTMKRHVTHWRFLLVNKLSKDQVVKALSSKDFYHEMLANINQQDYSCEALSRAYKHVYPLLFGMEIEEEFLSHTYWYVLSKSFPDAIEVQKEGEHRHYELYLNLLRTYNNFQKSSDDETFMSVYPFELLEKKEIYDLEDQSEYLKFKEAFDSQYIYEMMKLNYEVTGHSTIEHILGVHYLAMKIARQLKAAGVRIDLGRVSGAAAGHDIGKFGCRPEESKKIAYYHYYYTDDWFSKLDIRYIKNVAVYHSTWDLELESLSIESLVLIYSDFCVKRSKNKPGFFKMKFLTVDESFKVILDKLDNVDDKKRKRYERVYLKLKNFHDYLAYLGVNPYVANYGGQEPVTSMEEDKTYSPLDDKQKVVDHLKHVSIEKSIGLMYELRHIDSLNDIIQAAKSEKNIQMLRRYLFIFEEYTTYLTPEQKLVTIEFLSTYMVHIEEDIRKESSLLIGSLLADYDENYTKELPPRAQVEYTVETKYNLIQSMLNQFIFVDVRMTPVKRKRLVTSYYQLMEGLYKNSDEDFSYMLTGLLAPYFSDHLDEYARRFMLETINVIPLETLENYLELLVDFVVTNMSLDDESKLLAYSRLKYLINTSYKNEIIKLLATKYDLSHLYTGQLDAIEVHYLKTLLDINDISYALDIESVKSDMYLSNLKTATPKEAKIAQIELLYDHALQKGRSEMFYTAMHFCNILKVSAFELVRNCAGKHLLNLFDHLSSEQKNDIVIELIRALEIEGYGFTRYIPSFLGQLIPTLSAKEYKEIWDDIKYKLNNASVNIRVLLLDTIGSMIKTWIHLGDKQALEALVGGIFNGFYSGNKLTTQMAFNVISKEILGQASLTLADKKEVFNLMYKKLNIFLMDSSAFQLDIFNYSVGLHYIYHFITDYNYFIGEMSFDTSDKIAFYSGTFDPFSLGQKAAAIDAQNLGCEVLINISEFQWTRRTQPSLMRKRIIDMSISDLMNVHAFPSSLPINLRSEADLSYLTKMFSDKEFYLIIGEEALLANSLYDHSEHMIFDFNHIIYRRASISRTSNQQALIDEKVARFRSKVVIRTLEQKYEMIDVAQIRRNIDRNWDAYDVIDDLATDYIKKNNLYRNEPQFKSIVEPSDIAMDLCQLTDIKQVAILEHFDIDLEMVQSLIDSSLSRELLTIKETSTSQVIAYTIFTRAKPVDLFDVIRSLEILEDINEKKCENVLVIDAVDMKAYEKVHALDQIILTETIMYAIRHGSDYAIVKCFDPHKISKAINGVIIRSGFIEYTCNYSNHILFAADMREPIVINLDGTTRMKSDYRSNNGIRDTIKIVRSYLQQAVVDLYPGCLVVSFDRSMMYNHLIRMVTEKNASEDTYGPFICVPYGEIFKRWLLPNTITKAFHTERYYDESIQEYEVKAYPGYLSIEEQAKILKAYNKPVLLVDDLVDKGNRLKAINYYLKEESIPVEQVIVGIMSERGKNLFEQQGIALDAAYYFPKIKVWFNESDVYPFIGGDSVERGVMPQTALPSVNLMLPFVYPRYIKNTSKEALYNLSLVCLENALVILQDIERVYSEINNKVLTVEQLKEVMITPRMPDQGAYMSYDMNQKPSDFVRNELLRLKKLQSAFKDTN